MGVRRDSGPVAARGRGVVSIASGWVMTYPLASIGHALSSSMLRSNHATE
jgi:hypothetical protein